MLLLHTLGLLLAGMHVDVLVSAYCSLKLSSMQFRLFIQILDLPNTEKLQKSLFKAVFRACAYEPSSISCIGILLRQQCLLLFNLAFIVLFCCYRRPQM